MNRNRSSDEIEQEKREQIERGKRIKEIRIGLNMNKTQLAKAIGVSSQFLGLVEDGKGNLVYKSIKKLRDLSNHSADYILFGLDDHVLDETRGSLKDYSEEDLIKAISIIKDIALFIKKD